MKKHLLLLLFLVVQKMDSPPCFEGEGDVLFEFEGMYENDLLEFKLNGKTKFKENITTDFSTGTAGFVLINFDRDTMFYSITVNEKYKFSSKLIRNIHNCRDIGIKFDRSTKKVSAIVYRVVPLRD